jgi:Flp pilus assembly protein TadG
MRLRSTSKRLQNGQALIMFTMMVATVLIPIVGLAIDGSRGYLVRLKLSSAVDGGSLAAARLLGTGADAATQLANAKATATLFVNANFPAKFFGADLAAGGPDVCVDDGKDTTDPCKVGAANGGTVKTFKVRTVVVRASAQMPTFFMRIFGMPLATVSSNGVASRRDVRVVLVMDRSSSMSTYYTGLNQTPDSINDLALRFVNSFSGSADLGGRDEMGLVVFGGSAIVAYPPRDIAKDYADYTQFTPPNNNFKLAGSMPKYIADIRDGSNTGTAEALYLAYSTLRADANTNPDLATKLNVIVLFTDGLPNGITANANDFRNNTSAANNPYYMMKLASGCADLNKGKNSNPLVSSANTNTNMIGWFAQWGGFKASDNTGPVGLFKPMMAYADAGLSGHGNDIDSYMINAGDDSSAITQMTGCGAMKTAMARFPDRDLYGNATNLTVGAPAVPTGPTANLYEQGDLWKNSTQCNKNNYDPTATSNACQIGLASWQAAAHQAWKIWNQMVWDKPTQTNIPDPGTYKAQPIIFTIGFNHNAADPPDMTLLKIIANDPLSPAPFTAAGTVKGMAFEAPDRSAVDAAFQQISREILRLSQ